MPSRKPHEKWDFDARCARDDLKQVSVRGGMVTLGSQMFKFLMQMGSLFVLGRLLTPDDFGLVAMVAALVAFAQMFKDLGLSTATIQRQEITHEQVNTLFWVNVGVSGLLTVVTALCAPCVAWFFKEPRLVGIVLATSLGFFLGGLGVQHQALLSRQMRFKSLALVECASMLVAVVAAICCVLAGGGYWSLVVMQLALAGSYSGFCWVLCGWRPSVPALEKEAVPMLKFGKDLTGFSFVNYFARNLDNVLIGRVWGAVQLGLYAKAYQILLLPLSQLNGPMQAVALPALSRLATEPERYRAVYCKAIRLLSFAAMPLVGYMLVTADWLIPLILGPKWQPAVPMYRWLAIAGFLQPVANSTGWLFMSQGRGKDMFRWSFISTGLVVASFLIALPWGAVAVAASYALTSALIVCPCLFYYVTRSGSIRMRDFYASIALPALVTLAGMALLALFRAAVPIQNACLGLAITLLMWPVILLFLLSTLPAGRLSVREIKELICSNLPGIGLRRVSSVAAA